MVRDIAPGTTGSNPQNLVNLNGLLLFTVNDSIHGPELWRSNGKLRALQVSTAAPGLVPQLLKDINVDPAITNPTDLVAVGSTL